MGNANYGSPPFPEVTSFSISQLKATAQNAMEKLKPWLQQAMNGPDFHWLFFVLIFVTAYPSIIVVAIIGRRSLWSVGTYASKNMQENRLWKMFEPTWTKLKARETEVMQYSTLAEVLLGIWLTISMLLPTRQILACMLY